MQQIGLPNSSAAEAAQRKFLREMPEVVQIMSLLSATGTNLQDALQRVAQEGEGLASRWLRDTLVRASGKHLFTPVGGIGQQEAEPGVMRQRALESNLPEMVALSTQLDMIQQKGVGAQQLLGALADSVAREYQAAVTKRAEALGSKVVFQVMLFFFLPYLFALLAPLLRSVVAFMGS